MLIKFSFSNFRSFKDLSTLDMSPANLSGSPEFREIDSKNVNNCQSTKTKTLKVASIYGSNASGKTNVIKALSFMKYFVVNSSREGQSGDQIRVEPYLLNTETKDSDSGFEVSAIIDGVVYRYGFEVNSKEVVSEWLYYIPRKNETLIFSREGTDYKINGKFTNEFDGVQQKTRKNALFISVASQFNSKLGDSLVKWFSSIEFHSADAPNSINDPKRLKLKDAGLRDSLVRVLSSMDIGFSGINYEEVDFSSSEMFRELPKSIREVLSNTSKGAALKTVHDVYNGETKVNQVEFDLDSQESDGTRKLFLILPLLLETVLVGGIVVIDEMDARLHPNLTLALIKIFNGESNTKCGQLIFTTHDTNLLSKEYFRRDQIWFVEKDKRGASSLYSLAEIQTRNDANFEKDYLNGRYGAIPYINSQKIMNIL